MDIRKHPRFGVEFGSTFSGGCIAGQGMISNLSCGGCRVESAVTVRKGTTVRMHITLPDHPCHCGSTRP